MALMSTSELEPDRLWRIGERSSGGLRVSLLGSVSDPARAVRGDVPVPIVGEARGRGPARDLVGTYDGFLFLISPAFAAALEGFGATGWRAIEVEIPGVSESLSLLAGTGRVGPVIRASEETPVGPYKFGRFLAPGGWDGTDVFVPDNENTILLTDELATHLRGRSLSNLELEPAGFERMPAGATRE
jgi:hypothetical protein